MKLETVYFDEASMEHTHNVISAVNEFLDSRPEIEFIVVASTKGETGLEAAKAFQNKKVIVVTHMTGFSKPNENSLTNEKRKEIEKFGAATLTTSHAFAGIGRGFRNKLGTYTIAELIAYVYRTFGQGTKVCAEIAMMAADAGLVRVDKDIICIAGTGRGADTAWVVQPANTSDFTELKMKICICKPISF